MRVAYLVNCYPRVSHTFIREEIAALERQGVAVERFSVRRTPDQLVDEADLRERTKTRVILDGGKLRLLSAPLEAFARSPRRALNALNLTLRLGARSDRGILRHLAYLAEACVLLEWTRAADSGHVHAHFGTNSATVAMLCRLLGGPPYSFTAHGPEEFDNPVMLGLSEKIAHADFVIAISSFGRSQLYRRCSHSEWDKVQVVHCGLRRELLEAIPAPFPTRPRMVSVARLSEQKGQLLLIEAVHRLKASGVADLELVLVGDGELRGELEARIDALNLRTNVTITGWADSKRVRAELDAARVFVLPSFAEGLPVALMEALAVGRPVITTNVAGIAELVTPECGWLVPAGSIDALVDAMRQALNVPPPVLEQMGRVGAQRVRERHDVDVEAQRLAALLHQGTRPAT